MFSARYSIAGWRCLHLALLTSPLAPFAPFQLSAETVFLQPGADTTLIELVPNANLGGADFFNAGTTRDGTRNRALLWFDIASEVPVGALIESVTLTLDIIRQPAAGFEAAVFGLHRVNVPWGEGVQVPEDGSPGLGAPAVNGEATWLQRFVGGPAWVEAGGAAGADFESAASSATVVFGIGEPVVFESSEAMAADVQRWLNQPDQNFGWMLMTDSEDLRKSARSFASRENGGGGPMLMIEYTVVPEPGAMAILAIGAAALFWRFRRRS